MTEGSGGRVDRITRSAVNFGDHGTANYHEAPPAAGADETTVALLEAVRTLREHLRLLTQTDDTTGLDGELAVVQGGDREIGPGGPGAARLRLRMRLETAAAAVAGLASTAAVVQVIAQLAG
ncbi:hypothetical protein HEP87_32400 [Streptomyces sp. S1D4-11]